MIVFVPVICHQPHFVSFESLIGNYSRFIYLFVQTQDSFLVRITQDSCEGQEMLLSKEAINDGMEACAKNNYKDNHYWFFLVNYTLCFIICVILSFCIQINKIIKFLFYP